MSKTKLKILEKKDDFKIIEVNGVKYRRYKRKTIISEDLELENRKQEEAVNDYVEAQFEWENEIKKGK
tara:strand:+ start:46 stop:249 length:204 start_codon:yes stop_codon:yes gene_type:complete